MKKLCFVLSLVTLLGSLPASAEVFRWVDKNGKVSYSDAPPPEADAKSRRLYDSRIDNEKLPYETRQANSKFPLSLYVGEDCQEACKLARDWLQKRKAPFGERVLKTQADIDAAKVQIGKNEVKVPTLLVGNKPIEGFEASAWGSALDAAGYPK